MFRQGLSTTTVPSTVTWLPKAQKSMAEIAAAAAGRWTRAENRSKIPGRGV